MALEPLKKVTAAKAAEICRRFKLGAAARPLLADDPAPELFLDRLMAEGRYADAAEFLAHALPKREAVWWGCLCARGALTDSAPIEVRQTLQAAATWVTQPVEENRRAAFQQAEATGYDTPSSWAALGAFWSGGSIAPAGQPETAPGESMTGTAVTTAVMLAALQPDPADAEAKFRRFLEQGIDIAKGGSGKRKPGG